MAITGTITGAVLYQSIDELYKVSENSFYIVPAITGLGVGAFGTFCTATCGLLTYQTYRLVKNQEKKQNESA